MLILSRKKMESIVINDDIEVVVLGIQGNKIRIGIEAPKHISIHRMEVHCSLEEEGITHSDNEPCCEPSHADAV